MGAVAERKRELRRAVLARRDALDVETRVRASGLIAAAVAALDSFRRARVILVYSSFGSEPITDALLQVVVMTGRTLVLPRVNRDAGRLDLHRVDDPGIQLRAGTWGIREPDPTVCPAVERTQVEFVLVPGVAFDARGGRIGYGRGYYDRLLAELGEGTARVAGAFEVQLVEEVPMEPGDRRVDLIVTERGAYPG